jgi:hypothetical protein
VSENGSSSNLRANRRQKEIIFAGSSVEPNKVDFPSYPVGLKTETKPVLETNPTVLINTSDGQHPK